MEFKKLSALLTERQSAADRPVQLLKQDADLAEEIVRIRNEIRTAEGALSDIRQLEMEVSDLRKKWADLGARREELTEIRDLMAKQSQAAKELASLEAELSQLKVKTADARKAAASATIRPATEVVRVAFPAAGNNDLRPVFVECSATGLTVYPEKTFIAKAQIARSATYRAFLEQVRANDKLTLNFLIRPDGVEVFDEAREIARDRSMRYGYVPAPGSGRIVIAGEEPNKP